MVMIIAQIILCLLLAAALGFMIAWLLRNRQWQELLTDRKRMWEAEVRKRDDRLESLVSQADTSAARVHEHEKELRSRAASIEILTREAATLRNKISEALSSLEEKSASYEEVSTERKNLLETARGLREEQVTLQQRLEELEPLTIQIQERDTRIEELKRLHAVALRARDEENKRLQEMIVQLEGLKGEIAQREHQWKDLEKKSRSAVSEKERQLSDLTVRLKNLEKSHSALEKSTKAAREAESACRKSLGERESQLAELQSRLEEMTRLLPMPGRDIKDDLKNIPGIGPALERTLNDAGIWTFKQIATWTEEDIVGFSQGLGQFHDRVVRDKWVDGAREQHFLKYGVRL